MAAMPPQAAEASRLLAAELGAAAPSVTRASIILGVLQERLFAGSNEPIEPAISRYLASFQQLLVAPAAAKIGKAKQPQDKLVAIAKLLRGKLAKAPAHKQPLHTQFLPSVLRDSGKRQLDCLGIATCVLALAHEISAQHPEHAELAHTAMVVSDDHCWLRVQHHDVEVTDPRPLAASDMLNWLYGGGHGQPCSAAQVVLVLVAGLMPEELQHEAAAAQLRAVQLHLLDDLSARHPHALLYSNHFRWGMALEEDELAALAHAADARDMQQLARLALLSGGELSSQARYAAAAAAGDGWQWHPASCAAFGWLNRMQAALCGSSDNLLALEKAEQQQQQVAEQQQQVEQQQVEQQQAEQQQQQQAEQQQQQLQPWLDAAAHLLQQALTALAGCTAVLRRYAGWGKPGNKSSDSQLLEAVRDLWQNIADGMQAVAVLRQQQQAPGAPPQPGGVLDEPQLLLPLLDLMDALVAFHGDEAEVPAQPVEYFVAAVGCFTADARAQAAAEAAAGGLLRSARMAALAVAGSAAGEAWTHLAAGLQQQVQMPGSRKRKRKE